MKYNIVPFFHHICRPGSTQSDSQQQGIAFPPQLGRPLEGVSQTNGPPVSMPTVLPKNRRQRSGSATAQ